MSDFALRFGLALIVVIVAGAAIIISRRNYAKAAIFESSIEAFRLEFRRSIDAAQAATIKSVAKTIRESISSVIKPIDTAVLDLDARLARLEQQRADATASHVAQSEILEVRLAWLEERADGGALQTLAARLARLEERADGGAIQTLDARLAGLEKHNESTATKIAGTQKQALEENERIAARLIGLEQKLTLLGDALSSMRQTIDESVLREQQNVTALGEQKQNLTALSDQLSSIKQTIDAAAIREKDIKNSIDAVSSRVLTAQTRVDELFPRLVLGDKARNDLSALMSWFVKRLKTLNSDFTETSRRLGDLESRLHAQTTMLEEPATSIFEGSNGRSPTKVGDLLKEASKSGDRAGDDAVPTDANPIEANPIKASPVEAKTGGGQAEVLGRSAAGTEPSVAPSIEAL